MGEGRSVDDVTHMFDVLVLVIVFLEVASVVLSLDVWNHRHNNFPVVNKTAENIPSVLTA